MSIEEEVDSAALDLFLRHDYPEDGLFRGAAALMFRQALNERPDLNEMAVLQRLAAQLRPRPEDAARDSASTISFRAPGQRPDQVAAVLFVHVAPGHGRTGYRHQSTSSTRPDSPEAAAAVAFGRVAARVAFHRPGELRRRRDVPAISRWMIASRFIASTICCCSRI